MSYSDSSSTTVAKNSIFLAARMVVVTLISIFTTRFLLKNLGVEDFGVYNVTLGIVSICTCLSPALSNAIQRFFNFELGKNGVVGATKVFNAGIVIQLLMVVVIILFCETIGLWYVNEKLVVPEGREHAAFWVYQISVVAFSLSMLQVPFVAAILAHEKMKFYAIVNVLDAFLKLLISIGIAFSSYDKLIVYGFLLLLINIIDLGLYYCYSRWRFEEIRFNFQIDKLLSKGMLSFSGWNLLETIARIIKDQGGNIMLNFYFGPVLNAARGLTNQVSYAFTSIVDSAAMAARPQIVSSYAQGNYQHSLSLFYSISKGVLLLVFMLSLPVFLDVNYILRLWIGDSIPPYTVSFIRLSILVLLVERLATPVTAIIHATGKVKHYHLLSSFMNIIVMPISWLFFALGYNPTSIYIITLVIAVISQIMYLFSIKRVLLFSVKSYYSSVFKPFSILFVITVWLPLFLEMVLDEGIIRLLLIGVVSIVSVSAVSYFFVLTESEKQIIRNIIKQK